ncbi:MAG: rRNA pseudouridine synthase [Candidatus Marinimicrobia bacterium]|nr:rRNA pseudouridine synthase [Candidatus Neomarinimicrobiota bacterium]
MRLNKYLAHCGVDSRRNCDDMIFAGRVQVDGEVFTNPGAQIDETASEVRVDGDVIRLKSEFTYIKMNKPQGHVTTLRDPHNDKTVMDLLPRVLNVVPVGRLDKDTTGVLLFTDDGDLHYRLTHPKHEVEKEYEVLLRRTPEGFPENDLPGGIMLEDNGDLVKGTAEPLNRKRTHYFVTLKEGKKREVKRIFRHYNTLVYRLHRNSFAGISANELAPGKWKKLTPQEIAQIQRVSRET